MANRSKYPFVLIQPSRQYPQWTLYNREKRHPVATFEPDAEIAASLAFDAIALGVPSPVVRSICDHGGPFVETFLANAILTFRAGVESACAPNPAYRAPRSAQGAAA